MDQRTISQLRNLGPACERDLKAVGISTAADIRELGVEETFHRLLVGRIQRGESCKCINASYLYALYGALHDLDWRNIPQSKKTEFKKLASKLREQHDR